MYASVSLGHSHNLAGVHASWKHHEVTMSFNCLALEGLLKEQGSLSLSHSLVDFEYNMVSFGGL